MLKNAILTFILLGLLTSLPAQTARAEPLLATGYSSTGINFRPDFTEDLFRFNDITIKRGEPYDEKKDPALRKGTENEEMPQGSFFAVPTIIIGIALVFVWFNRE